MTMRDVANGFGWLLAAWGIGFTLDLLARADNVTSAQWRYLMSVPGGHFSWVAIFFSGALILIYGLAADKRLARSAGLAIMGLGCGLIAAFYVVAPFVDTGLTTLGHWPWLGFASVMLIFAVVESKQRLWL